jgi:hypothetical protein
MVKKEAELCSKLNKWWITTGYKVLPVSNYCIEAKVSYTKSFNFKSGFKEHQLPTLEAYNTKPMKWKISDLDQISTKHYDMSWTNPATTKALVAIQWVRRGNKEFYLIEPEAITNVIAQGVKSLTEECAKLIAIYIGQL